MIFQWKYELRPVIYIGLLIIFIAIQVYGAVTISSNFFITASCNANKNSSSIALTFDDGPIPENTDKLLSILKEHELEACFFCIGDRVKRHPALVKQMHEEGHIIGNHSYHHKWSFDLQSVKKMATELSNTNNAIEDIINCKPRFFRPPYGVTNPNLSRSIGLHNYHTIGWSVRSFDTVTKDPKKLLMRITRRLKSGDIVLFHDYSDSMLAVLPAFIAHAKEIGLKIVRVDKLLEQKPYFEK